MPAMIRGETSDCSSPTLDVFTRVSGVPTDVSSLEFQIFEKVTTPASPIQVFPAVLGTREPVDVSVACPAGDKITTGRYVAKHTVDLSAPIGTHEIRWFFKLLPTSPEQQFFEEFEVLGSAQPSADDTYISVSDVRAKGVADPPSDAAIQSAICLWQEFIDRATRQWFRPIALELVVDGTDSDALHFGVPIISIDEIRVNNEEDAMDTDRYRVYNATRYPFDKQNPRIKLVDQFESNRDIYTASLRNQRSLFRKGRQNQFIKGVFGCVDENGSAPALIRHALCKLVVEKLLTPIVPGTGGATPPPVVVGLLKEEWTDGHRIRFDPSGGALKPRAPGLAGITNDQEILGIIRLYKAPIGLATPAGPSFR